MPGDETLHKRHEESESEDDEVADDIPQFNVDVSKLTPLSPEVISKQVRTVRPHRMRRTQRDNLARRRST